jgi:hypothetical protein
VACLFVSNTGQVISVKYVLNRVVAGALVIALAPFTVATGYAQHDDHSSTDHHGGSSGHSSGMRGPKYMGGQKGESHSHEAHSGGPHRGVPSRSGSKHTEDKVFHGHEDHEEGDATAHNETP